MEDVANLTCVTSGLAVMSFVNATCARSGAFAKDRFDRNGLNLYWKDHVVLKVSDFVVGREGFEVTYDGRTEYDAVRAEVTFNRIKRRYYERYAYGNSITPDAAQVPRRSITWLLVYLFRRGVFEVQWSGISADARAAVAAARATGAYVGGMQPGATAAAEAAVRMIVEGQRAFAPEVVDEPLFVEFDAKTGVFLPAEMNTGTVASLFGEVSLALGLDPSHAGTYGARRSKAVQVRRGCDRRGMGEGLARKQMAHKITTQTFAQVYDDSLAAEDMGALSGEGADARAMEKVESLRSLLVTRVPRMSVLRSFANVPVGDPIRVALYDNDEVVLRWRSAIGALEDAEVMCGGLDAATSQQLTKAKRALYNRRQALAYRVLQTKRQQVLRDGQVELQTLPLAEVRKRVALRDWRGVGLEQVMLGYAVPRDLANHHRNQGKRPWLMSAERSAMWCAWERQSALAAGRAPPPVRGVNSEPPCSSAAGDDDSGATAPAAAAGAAAGASPTKRLRCGVESSSGPGATSASSSSSGSSGGGGASTGSSGPAAVGLVRTTTARGVEETARMFGGDDPLFVGDSL